MTKKYSDYSPERRQRMQEAVIRRRRKNKLELVEYEGGCCCKCGYNKCVAALEFHHLDPNEKDFSLTGSTIALQRQKDEADKCILVCSNCHREIHNGE